MLAYLLSPLSQVTQHTLTRGLRDESLWFRLLPPCKVVSPLALHLLWCLPPPSYLWTGPLVLQWPPVRVSWLAQCSLRLAELCRCLCPEVGSLALCAGTI